MKKTLFAAVIVVAAMILISSPAKADGPLVVSIDDPNAGLSATPGPYATVTVTLVGSTLHFDVVSAGTFTFFGSPDGNSSMFGFNVVGSTTGLAISNCAWVYNSVAGSGCGGDPGIQSGGVTGGYNMDGFGNFDAVIGDVGGNSDKQFTSFSFDVTRSGGFTSVFDVYEFPVPCGGEGCAHFAIHIAPTNGNPTGFAGDSGRIVPEPATVALFGLGLLGLAGLKRRLS